MANDMRALVATGSHRVEIVAIPQPAPRPDEVIVKVAACGICGSDVHRIEHEGAAVGDILGHEFAGLVTARGSAVPGWPEGSPVAVNPLGSCGSCANCRAGLPLHCPHAPNLGLNAPGGFADYVAVPARQLVALPARLDVTLGARAEPLAVGMGAVGRAHPEPGSDALVLGAGSIGLNVILALRLAGVRRIVAIDPSPARRAMASVLGADAALDPAAAVLADYAEEHGYQFASAYDCAGTAAALTTMAPVMAPGGSVLLIALTLRPVPLDVRLAIRKGLHVIGSSAFVPSVYERAVAHLVAGDVPAERMVNARIPLEHAPALFTELREPGNLVAVLVEPGLAT
jgi:threonine dehydrogenase-like Zn-dependent dehydrogenase